MTLPATPQRLTALIVDDNDALRYVVQRALEVIQIAVVSMSSATEALTQLDSRHFDLAITDLSMPEMDGWEFCAAVHRRRPQLLLGIMTGWDAPEQQQLDRHGIEFVIFKPFNIRELQAQVVAALRERGLHS